MTDQELKLIGEEKRWGYYQTVLRNIYDSPQVRDRIESVAYFIRSVSAKGGKLAEIGFGNGYLLELLHNEYECTGYDISLRNVELTAQEFQAKGIQNVGFAVWDITTGPLEYSYDVIVLSHVLEHFTNDQVKLVLGNVRQNLCPNGMIAGAVPFKQDLLLTQRICPNCGKIFEIDGHRQSFDEMRLSHFFTQSGFRVIKLNTMTHGSSYFKSPWWYRLLRRLYWKIRDNIPHGQLEFVAIRNS